MTGTYSTTTVAFTTTTPRRVFLNNVWTRTFSEGAKTRLKKLQVIVIFKKRNIFVLLKIFIKTNTTNIINKSFGEKRSKSPKIVTINK
jgi:hypothetical protein